MSEWIDKDLGPVDAYALAVAGGYEGTKQQWIAEIAGASTNASNTEAYAKGTRGGEAVASDDPAYHNNAKYYNEQAALEKASAQAAAATASAAYNVNLLAANYDATKTYAVGDHVIYSGGYYRCNTAITTAEAWTAAHWTQLTVGGEVTDLKSALSQNSIVSVKLSSSRIDANGDIVSAADSKYSVYQINITKGNNYVISTENNWSNGLFSIKDANGNTLDKLLSTNAGTLTKINNYILVVPDDATMLYIGSYDSIPTVFYESQRIPEVLNKNSIISKIIPRHTINADGEVVSANSAVYSVYEISIDSFSNYYLTAENNFGNCIYSIRDGDDVLLEKYKSSNFSEPTVLTNHKISITEDSATLYIGSVNGSVPVVKVERKNIYQYVFGENVYVAINRKKVISSEGQINDSADSGYCISDEIAVSAGDDYLLFANINYGNSFYVIYDQNDNVVKVYSSTATGSIADQILPIKITIPNGGIKMRVGWYGEQMQLFKVTENCIYNNIEKTYSDKNTTVKKLASTVIDQSGNIVAASNNSYSVWLVSVVENESLTISASMNWSNCIFAIYDSFMNVIYCLPTSNNSTKTVLSNTVIKMPSAAAFFAVGFLETDSHKIQVSGSDNRYISKSENELFIPTKPTIYNPFVGFKKVSDILVASSFEASDWRNTYPGLGYDIVYDQSADVYRMYYAAYNGTITQIGMMSTADFINWTQGNNPILSPSGVTGDADKGGMTFPQLLHYGNEWIMYYVGFDTQGFERGVHSICYATSTDLLNWERQGKIFGTEIFDSSEEITVLYRPNVRNYFGKYYMFINAGKSDASPGGNAENIYVLASDNPITGWEYVGKCIDAEILYSASSYKICADPCVVTNGNKFYMVCWSSEGIIGLYSDFNEFPMVWHYIGKLNAGVSRPLLVPTDKELYLISNTGNADVVSLYKSMWKG